MYELIIYTPPEIARLLEAQWGNHVKWITAGGAVSHRQLRKTQGLPQGDSSSLYEFGP